MAMTLRRIRYYVAVAEAGSVSRAARELGISQSAVTDAIKTLEQITGAALFRRHAKGVSLTHEGHQFLRHAHRILATVADAQRALATSAQAVSGTLNLGITPLVAGYYLADLLAHYRRVFPNVVVDTVEDKRWYVEHLVVNGEMDVAVMLVSNLEDQDALQSEILVRSPCRLWLPANHPLLEAERITLADIASAPMIALTVDEMENTIKAFWERAGLHPNVVLCTSSVEAVRSLVATGAGLAIQPDMAYRPWSLEGDRVEARELEDPVPSIDVGLAWRRGSPLRQPAQNFVELSREHSPSRQR